MHLIPLIVYFVGTEVGLSSFIVSAPKDISSPPARHTNLRIRRKKNEGEDQKKRIFAMTVIRWTLAHRSKRETGASPVQTRCCKSPTDRLEVMPLWSSSEEYGKATSRETSQKTCRHVHFVSLPRTGAVPLKGCSPSVFSNF